ncbi:DUF3850 domain-containing protein [Sutcliffiella sp. FSL R7-0096]|uniref:DUF3850 domain-containing protein n=1 Tax=Sutcliffiella sp. FSL R7-0096 TaxID=2921670 RepID=UPI00315A546F
MRNLEKEQPIIYKTDNRNIREHQLKTIEPYFSAVKRGEKTFEVRKFDRDFQVGDFIDLVHYNQQTKQLGQRITKRITYMLTDEQYVKEGYVILGMVDDEIEIPF